MTSRARRGAEVAASDHRFAMHAGVVLFELVRWDCITFHMRGVSVAARAGLSNVEGMHSRTRIARGPQVMHAVTVDADRHVSVRFGKKPSMHTRFVLAKLVGTQRRIVLAHERGVGVAAPAKRGDLAAFDFAAEPGGLAHSIGIGLGGIATVATGAGQPLLRMDVLSERLCGYLQRSVQRGVTIKAGILLLRASQAATEEFQQQQCHCTPTISPCIHKLSLR